MDKWILFKNAINDLLLSNYSNLQVKKNWQLIANDFKNYRPNHLLNLLYLLDSSRLKYKSRILDHGCGGGITLFFLVSQGYSNVLGIDINNTRDYIKRKNLCNKIFKIILNTNTDIIKHYNGKKINYENNSFDYIFSQQVIEHVESDLLDSYLSEERRVLKIDGIVLHQIPHRLGPFEGHTKKWFIHWLPKKWYYYLLKDDKHNLNVVTNALFLRWPWQLKSIFNKYFNNVNNLVNLRLKYDIVSEEYSIKEKIIRKVLIFLLRYH